MNQWLGFFFVAQHFFLFASEAANSLNLQTERASKAALDRYRVKRKRFHIFRAAAKLWAAGVNWEKALGVVTEAFDAATVEV